MQVYGSTDNAPETIPVGKRPGAVLLDEDANHLYVANYESSYVTVIDSNTYEIISELLVGTAPEDMVFLNGMVYVAHMGDDTAEVSVINSSEVKILKTIKIHLNAIGLAADSRENSVYVGLWNYPHGSIFVIDALSNEISKEVPIQNASESLAVNPNTGKIYMPNGSEGPTFIIDSATLEVSGYIATPNDNAAGGLIAVNPTTNTVYLIKRDPHDPLPNDGLSVPQGTLFLINGTTNAIVSNTTLASPAGMAVDESKNRVYVTNLMGGSLYVLDGSTGAILDEIPVGEQPAGIAFNQDNGDVYVANSRSNTISVIEGVAIVPEFPGGILAMIASMVGLCIVLGKWRFSLMRNL
jgi:YVTN family beta-propeller protein